MKNNKNIILIFFCVLLLAISVVFFNKKIQNKNFNPEESNKNIELILYHNSNLGFSIKIPFKIATVRRCPEGVMESAPVKVFENNEDGIVYIVPEYYYDANWDSKMHKFTRSCIRMVYSLDMLEDQNVKPFLGWKIVINNLKDEDDFKNFIKKNFGSGCVIKDMVRGKNENYNITLKGKDWDKESGLGGTDCLINYSYRIIYSKDKNKMMSVVLGQECTFGTDPATKPYYCYDYDMINSFEFD